MDADTRHELKTNELATKLLQLRDMADKYWMPVSLAIVAVIAIFVSWRLMSYWKQQSLDENWGALAQVAVLNTDLGDAPLDAVRGLIADAPNERFKTLARMRLASGLLARGLATGDVQRFQDARTELDSLLASGGLTNIERAAVQFRLAGVHESLREIDKAKALYEKLAADSTLEGVAFRRAAEVRLQDVDRLSAKVTFTPGSAPPPPAPATRPVELIPLPDTPGTQPSSAPVSSPNGGSAAPESQPASQP